MVLRCAYLNIAASILELASLDQCKILAIPRPGVFPGTGCRPCRRLGSWGRSFDSTCSVFHRDTARSDSQLRSRRDDNRSPKPLLLLEIVVPKYVTWYFILKNIPSLTNVESSLARP